MICHGVLREIARRACGDHICDEVRAATTERDLVIAAERKIVAAAVGAASREHCDFIEPFSVRMRSDGTTTSGALILVELARMFGVTQSPRTCPRSGLFAVGGGIHRPRGDNSFAVFRIPGTVSSVDGLAMGRAPYPRALTQHRPIVSAVSSRASMDSIGVPSEMIGLLSAALLRV